MTQVCTGVREICNPSSRIPWAVCCVGRSGQHGVLRRRVGYVRRYMEFVGPTQISELSGAEVVCPLDEARLHTWERVSGHAGRLERPETRYNIWGGWLSRNNETGLSHVRNKDGTVSMHSAAMYMSIYSVRGRPSCVR